MTCIFTAADVLLCVTTRFSSFDLCWQICGNEGAARRPLLQSAGWMNTSQIERIIQFIRRRKGLLLPDACSCFMLLNTSTLTYADIEVHLT